MLYVLLNYYIYIKQLFYLLFWELVGKLLLANFRTLKNNYK